MADRAPPGLRRAEVAAGLLDDAVTLPLVGVVGLDPLLGLLPLVGDLIDVVLRANRRNVRLFRRHVEGRG